MNEFDRLFESIARLSNPSYGVGFVKVGYDSDDTVPRYVENPEWKIKNLEEQIGLIDKRAEYYDAQIDNIISLKGELKKQKKDLKNKLEKLRNSD